MTHAQHIHEILINRDVDAFLDADWEQARADFDADAFVGYSGATGTLELTYPTLTVYGEDWLAQAARFRGCERAELAEQLHAAQRIDSLEIKEDRALATKIFDGTVMGERLSWTTYYFLRFEPSTARWLITGFVGYLPKGLRA